ncbi:hypothetical protein UFOVP56_14 [uncultured Caudovirales phage]|uniref:Uncharacterized protein n=1 Tax=uncultured Caudovirales phage TaxID=2100421 RepID=A0A6J5T815_9CAUD|nr:hypothetical protein UFOVP56_14 [uncultured Caudovirales phage]
MAQSGYTPILIYASGTTTNTPLAANLANGVSGAELALNYADGKLFYKDNSNVVQVLATKGGVGSSTTTQVLYNSAGLAVGSANFTFDGTTLKLSGLTASTALALDASKNIVSVANTGTGSNVLATSPALVTPDLGTPSALVGTNISGTATAFTSGITNALKSATTTVNVSSSPAPSTGQVLTATSATAATWQTPAAGGSSLPITKMQAQSFGGF